ncbi:MAG: glycosyltransferase [Gemmatimonadetes bacterium]|nr:glycosyltransferase [Gemmatimonadota bacterium]
MWPRALARWFATRRPDVVHVHSGVWLKAARAARMAGRIPVVHTVHGLLDDGSRIERPYQRIASFLTDSIVTVSQSLREDLTQRVGIPESKVHTIVNGIDTVRFAPSARTNALRRRLHLDDSHRLIGHVGRFAPVKNQAMLIDAFATIARVLPSARLVLVGDGPLRSALEERVAERQIQDLVHFVGEQRDLAPILCDLDVFVLCSFSEGTSIALPGGYGLRSSLYRYRRGWKFRGT